uniref:Transmembrane and coiled-coil domain-containing protein 4 n=1 Tax=Plectus sambesii TaxID=2011161 RepID=A0A914VLQ6_9BILA
MTGAYCRDSKEAREKKQRGKKIKRILMITAAGGVGGVIIGLTGGLAAPFVAAGAGVVIGTGAAAGIATTAGAAVLGSLFGVAGAGLAGYKMKKRVGAIEEFTIETLSDGSSLHCVLAVSGWIEDQKAEDAFKWQWRHLNLSKEQYTLRYEGKYLVELGKAMEYLMSFAVSYAIQQTLMETALAGLVAAIAWPVTLLSVASVLDNPWNVCIRRASEVGHYLAEVLLCRQHGQRPVTLVGFSLGARVIYHCLLEMSRRGSCLGLIEDVVLLGAPVTASPKEWRQMCRVVGGRVINGYCTTDWLLKFLYRTMSVQFTIAGTGPVENKNERKIVNFNLTHLVSGHMDYSRKLTEVLEAVGVKVTPHSSESSENLARELEKQATISEDGKQPLNEVETAQDAAQDETLQKNGISLL